MTRQLFARGSKGFIVRRMQEVLKGQGHYAGMLDGDFGGGTEKAIRSVQADGGLPVTGIVDDASWRAFMHADIPSLFDRCLQLTSRFEGHGFTMAAGNWDGAWLTWGIIGFTLKHGEIGQIVRQVQASNPGTVQRAFGPLAEKLLDIVAAKKADQQAWADSISVLPRKYRIQEEWRAAFEAFGQEEIVQSVQLERARFAYYEPATQTAQALGLESELGTSLCFDVHVQNGGVKDSARARIEAGMATLPEGDEDPLRELIANSVADVARPEFRADVRARKLAIARGAGSVHGEAFALDRWGLLA